MAPGVVVLWSNAHARAAAYALPPRGTLALDRMLAPDDDQVSNRHAEIGHLHGQLRVADLGSRNGTHIDGVLLNTQYMSAGRIVPPALIRIGRTLMVAVADIQPYLDRGLVTRHRLPVWASLHQPCEELDRAILDESCVAIIGSRWLARSLGRAYVAALGGGPEIDLAKPSDSLEARLGGAMPRAVMLIEPGALTQPDLRTLRIWLETNVRFVTCARRERELDILPREIQRWLVPKRIAIPEPRFDELPTVIERSVAAVAPGMEIHASAIEEILLETHRRGEDEILRRVGDRVRELIRRRSNMLRGGIFRPDAPAMRNPTYVQFQARSFPPDDD